MTKTEVVCVRWRVKGRDLRQKISFVGEDNSAGTSTVIDIMWESGYSSVQKGGRPETKDGE